MTDDAWRRVKHRREQHALDGPSCGAPSPGGGLTCELPPHPESRGHLWLHEPRHSAEKHRAKGNPE